VLIGLKYNFITDLTDIIQQLPVLGNYEITAYTVKAEEKGETFCLSLHLSILFSYILTGRGN
jgi:hypothetical protein